MNAIQVSLGRGMKKLYLSFFGPFQARLDGEEISTFKSNKVRTLLAYLAVEAGAGTAAMH